MERVNSDRAAALKAAVESGTIKGTTLEAALGDFRCDKMGRAWRTRSPVTHGEWTEPARKLLGTAADLAAVGHLAAALYAAASDYSHNGNFRPAALEPHTWKHFPAACGPTARNCRTRPFRAGHTTPSGGPRENPRRSH